MSDERTMRVLRIAMWYSAAIGLMALVGFVGSAVQGNDEWWPYLRNAINYFGFAALFRVIATLVGRLIVLERSDPEGEQ